MQDQPQRGGGQSRPNFIAAAAIAVTLTIGLAGASASARLAGDAIPSDLAQAWHDYDRATVAKDVARLGALVTDDYMLVNSDSSVQDKQSYLADFNMPGFTLEPYAMEQPFQKMWGDTALTGGLFNLGWTQEGRRENRRLHIAHVWRKKDGRWRIAYTQLTRVPG